MTGEQAMAGHNMWLLAAGVASLVAAALHLACIVGGPDWYRYLGAGEAMARAAAAGRPGPALVTFAIASILAIWGAYALSGAGFVVRLPLLRPALVVISAIYCLRGAVLFFPGILRRPDLSPAFLRWSSAIVLAIGLIHVIGTVRSWQHLNGKG
jgi:hypothetical protein